MVADLVDLAREIKNEYGWVTEALLMRKLKLTPQCARDVCGELRKEHCAMAKQLAREWLDIYGER